jgi:glycosyltransferase involved in cell wall biosynthesis
LHLTNVHGPDNYRVYGREIKTLADNGYQVKYIVPGSDDYKNGNVEIIGVKQEESEWKRIFFTGYRVFSKAMSFPKNSILHFHSPEWMPYALLAKLWGRTIIYDIHEDVPRQVYTKVWIPNLLKPVISTIVIFLEWVTAQFADHIIACEPITYKRFRSEKTILLRNYPLNEEFKNVNEFSSDGNRLVYIGQITRERGIIQLVKALEKLGHIEGLELVLGGEFVPVELKEECRKLTGWKYVKFKGYLDRSQVVKELSSSQVGLLVLNPIRKYRESYPVKLFEYMASGIPIVMSNFESWKKSIEPYNVSWETDPLDVDDIAEKIEMALTNKINSRNKGLEGRRAFIEKFNWDSEKGKLLALYKELHI